MQYKQYASSNQPFPNILLLTTHIEREHCRIWFTPRSSPLFHLKSVTATEQLKLAFRKTSCFRPKLDHSARYSKEKTSMTTAFQEQYLKLCLGTTIYFVVNILYYFSLVLSVSYFSVEWRKQTLASSKTETGDKTKSNSRTGFPELTLSVWYCVPGRGLGCRDTRQTFPQFLHYHWEYQPKTIFKEEKNVQVLT